MRGAPQSGFSMLIRRISARRSVPICRRPPSERDFQRQWYRKPARCQRINVSGWMIVMALMTEGNHRYCWMKNKRSSFVSRTRPCSLLPQHDQLLSERRVLGFKLALRLEWRGQDIQDEIQQRDYCALMLGDSTSYSIRTRFSVHTGPAITRQRGLGVDQFAWSNNVCRNPDISVAQHMIGGGRSQLRTRLRCRLH